MIKETKKSKRIFFAILMIFILLLIILGVSMIYNLFFNINTVANGDYLESLKSPNNEFTLNAYFIDGGSLSGDAIRVELINNQNSNKKNIYWDYPKSNVSMKWIYENTVEINGKVLNIYKDTYDWRKNN